MSVYKQGKKGIYWYEFAFRAKRIRQSTRQRNANMARHMEAAHRTALLRGEVGIKDPTRIPTVVEFAKRFLLSIETNSAHKPRTIKFYRTSVKGLLEFDTLANARIDTVDEALVDAYKTHRKGCVSRRGRPYNVSTINRELAALRRMLGVAHEWKLIHRIPRVRQLRGATGREFILSPEEETLYLGAAEPEYHDFAILLLDAGLRPGEALSLEWTEVHLKPAAGSERGYLTIPATKAKNSKARHIPLTPRLSRLLASRTRKKGHVLEGEGQPLTPRWVQKQHDALRNILKLSDGFVPHSLRHTFGTRLGLAGADAFTIMRLMGHSSIVVSQRYVHPTPDALERAIASMAGMWGSEKMSPPKSTPVFSESPMNRAS